jgi:hypothetical protein
VDRTEKPDRLDCQGHLSVSRLPVLRTIATKFPLALKNSAVENESSYGDQAIERAPDKRFAVTYRGLEHPAPVLFS